MSGHVGDLSPEQEDKLNQFKETLRDILRPEHDDYYLLRWLRARKFNIFDAETMLRKSLKWREKTGADTILQDYDPPEIFKKYAPGNIIGHDKDGCPLLFIPCTNVDLRGFLSSVKKEDIAKYFVWLLERIEEDCKEQTKKLGKQVETCLLVQDWDNFPLRQIAWKPSLDLMIYLVKIYEANYPEMLKKACLLNEVEETVSAFQTGISITAFRLHLQRDINQDPFFCEEKSSILRSLIAPTFLKAGYFIVRPFLSEETQQKILIYLKGSSWKEDLSQLVDPDELPKYWGGTKVGSNGDPKCASLVQLGGEIPKSYYFSSSLNNLSNHPMCKKAVIPRGSEFPIELDIKEPGSIIQWEFMTENHDIKFGVFFRNPNSELHNDEIVPRKKSSKTEEVPVVPMRRVSSHVAPEDGLITCHESGIYVLKFDNSFSWYNSKKITYVIDVSPPPS